MNESFTAVTPYLSSGEDRPNDTGQASDKSSSFGASESDVDSRQVSKAGAKAIDDHKDEGFQSGGSLGSSKSSGSVGIHDSQRNSDLQELGQTSTISSQLVHTSGEGSEEDDEEANDDDASTLGGSERHRASFQGLRASFTDKSSPLRQYLLDQVVGSETLATRMRRLLQWFYTVPRTQSFNLRQLGIKGTTDKKFIDIVENLMNVRCEDADDLNDVSTMLRDTRQDWSFFDIVEAEESRENFWVLMTSTMLVPCSGTRGRTGPSST
jgi:hypothetical protein